ncbi:MULTISPECIES: AI-2E family transporter [unclassified Haladaptatus]|uniref:AI-2E family transporter n=1 Tax=unclassified Haladaptatus TaxID=2622732 RepID=UPI00209BC603|nr:MULTISPECIES: AI-2E family transporter [unclassified Haladaptatus]MCO8243951.1 AI-2E family transporter [Haladaptatus sp. AB643]MCO8256486.1 AI-2E family transporter [Haladaptatus sp. AB618]
MEFSEERSRIGWWALAIVLAAALAFVAYAFVGTLVLGLFIYYGSRPIYRRVTRYVESKTLAAAGTLFLLSLPALALVGYTVAVGVRELSAYTGAAIGTYYSHLFPGATSVPDLLAHPQRLLTSDFRSLWGDFTTATESLGIVSRGLLTLFLSISFAFFALRDGNRLADWFRGEMGEDSAVVAYVSAVDSDLAIVYFGNVLTVLLVGVAATLLYNWFAAVAPDGVAFPLPTVFALLTGLATFVPIVVGKLVYVPLTLYFGWEAFEVDSKLLWFPLVFFLVSLVLLDLLPQTVIRPYISGRTTHTGLVMFAYILGGVLFGWYGIFLGPLVLVLVVQFADIVFGDLVHGRRVTPTSSLSIGSNPPDEARSEKKDERK